MNPEQLSRQVLIEQHKALQLTAAVEPAPERSVVPREGYRRQMYSDAKRRLRIPTLAAAMSRDDLFPALMDMIESLGEVVDVVLETSHETSGGEHIDLYRERIDLPVLMSHLYDFEDLLLNDGCTGIAVLSTVKPIEVQFDEHKLLIVYARKLRPFERILKRYGLRHDPELRLITEGEHVHHTSTYWRERFEQLCYRLGIEEPSETLSW